MASSISPKVHIITSSSTILSSHCLMPHFIQHKPANLFWAAGSKRAALYTDFAAVVAVALHSSSTIKRRTLERESGVTSVAAISHYCRVVSRHCFVCFTRLLHAHLIFVFFFLLAFLRHLFCGNLLLLMLGALSSSDEKRQEAHNTISLNASY